ncbi:MAG TPA: trypsin-like peptidase domain-containing protein [Gammaproteobacteria bacterium]
MPNSFTKILVLWLLLIASLWLGLQLYRDLVLTADTPRAVTARGSLAEFEQLNTEIFARISPSVAYIFTESPSGLFGGGNGGAGSGFIWDAAGHVVTNFHVIEGASRVAVRLDSGEAIPASVVGVAPDYDLAVLRLRDYRSGLQPIPVGSSADLRVGQAVLAIGNPYGLTRTLTTGIISALGRRLPTDTGREIAGVIQTDAAINPGNSGGPLLDSAGRLIGVNTAIISGSGASAGIGFAVPVDVVNRVVPQVIANGKAARPGIGISAADEALAARLGIDGIVVMEVVPGGSAARAGLRGVDRVAQALGDVITHVDGNRVRTLAELALELERVGIGNSARLTVLRDGREVSVAVTVIDIS